MAITLNPDGTFLFAGELINQSDVIDYEARCQPVADYDNQGVWDCVRLKPGPEIDYRIKLRDGRVLRETLMNESYK